MKRGRIEKEAEEKVFAGVTELVIKGHVSVHSIDALGLVTLSDPANAEVKKVGCTLHIGSKGGGGGTTIIGGGATRGGVTIMGSNQGIAQQYVSGSSTMTFGGGSFISNVGSGGSVVSIIIGHRFELRGNTLYMDGKRMVAEGEEGKKEEEEAAEVVTPPPTYKLALDSCITSISVLGTGGVANIDPSLINTRDLSLLVAGSASIAVDQVASDRLTCTIKGTGDIQLNNTTAKHATLCVKGIGSIVGLRVLETGDATVLGIGSIHGTKAAGATVKETVRGMGKIRF